ncbi:Crp/Fnr family transcriptional regulator [Pikeienuella piscinae]|uniref:Crp/Fnr family transcriptional regulator n=1 Tax=Pikeienuella piscinae TaxID=2748098 RepID=A0A7L5C2W7_9RHOB|nr:Crp/Fnr family transcriptional regulator [Pikeienuella piscinae]QIE56229.1 Crp/Fnr family transcriptional regulator [Pikeienuella piscinae]
MADFAGIPLLEGLPEDAAAQAAPRCRWKTFEAHELIVDYGDESNDVLFIISGQVRVLMSSAYGRHVILNHLDKGDFFGEMSAIDGRSRSASVIALYNSEICVMPGEVFMEIATSVPLIARRTLEKLTERVRTINERLAEQAFLTARQRLCAELLRQSRPRSGHPGQRIVSPPPIQEDLANLISSRREVVSRELSALTKDGVMERSRGGLILTDVDELSRRVEEAMGPIRP